MKIKKIMVFFLLLQAFLRAQYLLIPMDLSQNDHLKAYGIAYWVLTKDINVEWLLNYRGGSFLFTDSELFRNECRLHAACAV